MIENIAANMMFESFEETELQYATGDESECRLALVNKLGLKGQKIETGVPLITFPKMTLDQHVIFSFFCPKETELATYSESPVPLRVLEIADKAMGQGVKCLTVWHPEVVRTDPILVGRDNDDRYKATTLFLLARWGAELDEWPALLTKFRHAASARVKAVAREAAALAEAINESGIEAIRPHMSSWTRNFQPRLQVMGL